MKERRQSFAADAEKFSTQRGVTYFLLVLFGSVSVAVFCGSDQAERSTVLQTIINFTLLAVGFWLGSSKGQADKDASISRMAEVVAAPAIPTKAENVQIDAMTATVTEK